MAVSKPIPYAQYSEQDVTQNDGKSLAVPSHLFSKNESTIDAWLKGFSDFEPSSGVQITENLAQMGTFEASKQDQMQYLTHDQHMVDWLQSDDSCNLMVYAETAPQDYINPISAASAMLVLMMTDQGTEAGNWAVLSFFGGRHRPGGPAELVNCLIGQLLAFVLKEKLEIDLGVMQVEQKYRAKKVQDNPERAMRLLKKILAALPDDQVVLIILDSFSRLMGERTEINETVERLFEAANAQSHLTIKILVTDPLPNCPTRQRISSAIYLPDEVDGWECGVSREILEEQAKASVERFKQRHAQPEAESSEESDDDDSDSDSD